ncbi:unnamed protein product (macronuclear) [Paramecium tetraurelia]|uniref:AB hydrolase-1 domain-containing protein n=1 Tax=Paramecium tetraurelia TaxID=5888 RepID=A0DY72_PARTE|nr:uncharacterized protein GSPATT00002957001 [Paramecium tetraurelia]CAK87989.1 unnamed protein product [Paramecium tetraurelia]|eukprot:XP_001455386.1 hypothetical protein (macronuclear) [Paramecium tetraurelia strain d4-2]
MLLNLIQIVFFNLFVWIIKPLLGFGLSFLYYFTYSTIEFTDFILSLFVRDCEIRNKNFINQVRIKVNELRPYPGVYTSATDMITEKGYNLEIHQILTEDGYILTAWRLYKTINKEYQCPIVLQHGLLDSSWSWFINNTNEQTLPYILADKGYDVWLTNNRGNKYSMGHSKIPGVQYNKQYWNFSFDDIQKYDFKAIVNHVKRASQKEKVIYIGHSQGSTQAFAYLSNNIDFQENLKCFIALGPVIYIKNSKSVFLQFAVKTWIFEFTRLIGIPYFFVFDDCFNLKIGALCDMIPWIYRKFLFSITNLICGYPLQNKIDLKKFGFMVSHEPGGTSTKTLVQWMQFYRNGTFSYFDYGRSRNITEYGQSVPPKYNVENLCQLKIPKYFYIGSKDVIADEKDLQKTIPLFDPSTLQIKIINDYAHLDYVWAIDAHKRLYPNILENIEQNQTL